MLYPWRSTCVRLTAAAVGAVAAAVVAVTVIAAPASPHITLSTGRAASGSTVDGSGGGFSPQGSSVQLHLDRSTGSTLWSGAADRSGAVAFSFTVPSVAAGSHTVVATQTGRDGEAVSGTPATAPLQITAASPASAAATQSAQPQNQQASQQKQPGSQPHGQPQVPGASPVTTAPSAPSTSATAGPPVVSVPPAAAPPVVFSLPAHGATRLANPPPQVATMWRVAGAVPNVGGTAPVSTPARPSPAASAGSRASPQVLTLLALAVAIASAIVLIAATLQLRSADPPAAPAERPEPQRPRSSRRKPTVRSPDLWSGSPARLR